MTTFNARLRKAGTPPIVTTVTASDYFTAKRMLTTQYPGYSVTVTTGSIAE